MVKFKINPKTNVMLDTFNSLEVGFKLFCKVMLSLEYENDCDMEFKQPIKYSVAFPSKTISTFN